MALYGSETVPSTGLFFSFTLSESWWQGRYPTVAQLTNSVDESPYRKWRVSSDTQDTRIPRVLLNSNVPWRDHLFVSRSMYPPYAVTSYSLNNHSNIISQTPTSSKWSLSFRLPHQDSVCISLLGHACHIPFPFQPPWSYHLIMTSTNHEAPNYVIFPVFSPFHLDFSPVLNRQQSIFIP